MLDIVIIVERRIGFAIRENVPCEIDYGVSLSLVVIEIYLLHFLYIFHYGKMELWRSKEFRSCDFIAREEEGETRIPCTLPARQDSVLYRQTLTLDTLDESGTD
jgi:hypothetical protein